MKKLLNLLSVSLSQHIHYCSPRAWRREINCSGNPRILGLDLSELQKVILNSSVGFNSESGASGRGPSQPRVGPLVLSWCLPQPCSGLGSSTRAWEDKLSLAPVHCSVHRAWPWVQVLLWEGWSWDQTRFLWCLIRELNFWWNWGNLSPFYQCWLLGRRLCGDGWGVCQLWASTGQSELFHCHVENAVGVFSTQRRRPVPTLSLLWDICWGTGLSLECPALSWCPTEFPSTSAVSGTCLPQMLLLGSLQPLSIFFQCSSLNQRAIFLLWRHFSLPSTAD